MVRDGRSARFARPPLSGQPGLAQPAQPKDQEWTATKFFAKQIIHWGLDSVWPGGGLVGQLLGEFRAVYGDFYAKAEVRPEDPLLDTLADPDDLDAGCLRFKRIFTDIRYPGGLGPMFFFR